MLKSVFPIALKAAVIALIASPIAAQANTRAGDSGAIYTASFAQPGSGRDADGESIASGSSFLIGLLVGLGASGLIAIIADDDDDQSPGT